MNQTNVTSQGLSPGASLRVLGVRSGQATDVGAPQTWAPRLLMARTRQISNGFEVSSNLTADSHFCCVFDLQIFECHCVDSHFFGWLGNYPTLPKGASLACAQFAGVLGGLQADGRSGGIHVKHEESNEGNPS